MSREKQIEEMAKVMCEDCAEGEGPCRIAKSGRMCDSVWEQAVALYEAGYRKQEWISVDERLPDIIDTFLVVVKMKYPWEETWEYNVDVAVYQPFEEGYIEHWDTWNDWDEGQECHITHWLPLPEAPKMKGGAE